MWTGLFRQAVPSVDVAALRHSLELELGIPLGCDVHVVCAALLQFLNELPGDK